VKKMTKMTKKKAYKYGSMAVVGAGLGWLGIELAATLHDAYQSSKAKKAGEAPAQSAMIRKPAQFGKMTVKIPPRRLAYAGAIVGAGTAAYYASK
jgi:hypothetical protein